MDSEYIRQNDMHEKYVLNQLDEKEKAEYEAFLKNNPQAQKELAGMRILVEGVRAAGRNTMHKEIARQADELRQPKTDWSILYKAAAVLFIFVLVPSVIYYQMSGPSEIPAKNQIVKIPAPTPDMDALSVEDEHTTEEFETVAPVHEENVSHKQAESLQPQPQKKSTGSQNEMAGSGYKSETIIPQKDKAAENKNNLKDINTQTAQSLRTDVLKSESRMSKAYRQEQKETRTLVFSKYKPPVELILFRTVQKEMYPQKLDVHITEDETMFSINLAVSPGVFLFKDEQIKLKFNARNRWIISFTDSVTYSLNLDSDPPVAKKVQK